MHLITLQAKTDQQPAHTHTYTHKEAFWGQGSIWRHFKRAMNRRILERGMCCELTLHTENISSSNGESKSFKESTDPDHLVYKSVKRRIEFLKIQVNIFKYLVLSEQWSNNLHFQDAKSMKTKIFRENKQTLVSSTSQWTHIIYQHILWNYENIHWEKY